MPLRSRLWELFTWQKGGPDGDMAFTSLSPMQVVHRDEKMRSTAHMRLMRSIMTGKSAELGAPLQNLLKERERLSEAEAQIFKSPKMRRTPQIALLPLRDDCDISVSSDQALQSSHHQGPFRRPSVVKPSEPLAGKSLPASRRASNAESQLHELWSSFSQRQGSESEEGKGEVCGADSGADIEAEEADLDHESSDCGAADDWEDEGHDGLRESGTPSKLDSDTRTQSKSRESVVKAGSKPKPAFSHGNTEDLLSPAESSRSRKRASARSSATGDDFGTAKPRNRNEFRKGMSIFGGPGTANRKSRVNFSGNETKRDGAKKKHKKVSLPFKIISWSSQRRSFRCAAQNLEKKERDVDSMLNGANQWETDARPDHFLFVDLGVEVELSCVKLRCTGTHYDPKNITILRGLSGVSEVINEHLKLSREAQRPPEAVAVNANSLLTKGTWAVVKRASLKSGPDGRDKHVHTLPVHGAQTRFLQLVFHESWSSTGNIRLLQPLSVFGTRLPTPPITRRVSLSTMFSEKCLLDDAEMETRKLSRQFDIPLDYTHSVRREFLRFDTDKKGYLSYQNFCRVVKALTARHTLCRADAMLQENHLRALWNIVDKDGSGCVEFEEFLQWFHSHFLKEKPPARSLHSGMMVESVTEHFYASMGVNRLRGYLTSFGEGEEAEEDEHEADGEDSRQNKKTVWLRASLVAATGKGKLAVARADTDD